VSGADPAHHVRIAQGDSHRHVFYV
jgi:hypothetical protein